MRRALFLLDIPIIIVSTLARIAFCANVATFG